MNTAIDYAGQIAEAQSQEELAGIADAALGAADGLEGQKGQINEALATMVAAITNGATSIGSAAGSLASALESAGQGIQGQITAAIQAKLSGAPAQSTETEATIGEAGQGGGVPPIQSITDSGKLVASAGGSMFSNATINVYRKRGTNRKASAGT
jgi:hypothetical protein